MKSKSELILDKYLSALLQGKRALAHEFCFQFIEDGHSIKELYEEIMKPALYEVGKLWEHNKISVATEHLATAISEGILNSLYTSIIPWQYNGKKVVLACVEKEEHQVGIKMVADVFEMNQWESFYLGTGFPSSELIKYIKDLKPDLIGISLSVYFNFSNLKQMLNDFKAEFPHTDILVGGQALSYLSDDAFSQWEGVKYIQDLHQLEDYLQNQK
jgi:methanogenic corrinoid protein MtbC1